MRGCSWSRTHILPWVVSFGWYWYSFECGFVCAVVDLLLSPFSLLFLTTMLLSSRCPLSVRGHFNSAIIVAAIKLRIDVLQFTGTSTRQPSQVFPARYDG